LKCVLQKGRDYFTTGGFVLTSSAVTTNAIVFAASSGMTCAAKIGGAVEARYIPKGLLTLGSYVWIDGQIVKIVRKSNIMGTMLYYLENGNPYTEKQLLNLSQSKNDQIAALPIHTTVGDIGGTHPAPVANDIDRLQRELDYLRAITIQPHEDKQLIIYNNKENDKTAALKKIADSQKAIAALTR
jgi:hypothetical protein